MRLVRQSAQRPLISLVPMIDVLLILLVFFMVTSTYLNLDTVPFVQRTQENAVAPDNGTPTTMMLRIAADGEIYVRGQVQSPQSLATLVADRLQQTPLLSVVVFPSTQATTQHLVTAMDTLTRAGATRLRLVQLEPAQ